MFSQYKNHIEHYRVDGEYYDYFAFDKFMVEEIRRRYQEIYSRLNLKPDEKILEIGTGGGGTLCTPNICKYYALDLSYHNLSRIRNETKYFVFATTGDAYQLPFKYLSCNYIIMAEVIEHLEKPQLVLLECNRVLSDDGILVVSVPYKEKIGYQICIHCNKPTPTHSHLHTFKPDSLIELINQSGFKLIKMSKYLNKVLNRLHLNLMLKAWPLYSWKAIDKIFNMIIDKPTSMIVWCKKSYIP